jgi:nucleotide-binding universal stress UspA family protein
VTTAVNRIVVGVDGSPGAQRAVRWAAALARVSGAEIVAVHALGLLAHLGGDVVPSQSHRAEITAKVAQWCEPLSDAGVAYRAVVADGNPVTALLAEADEVRADLIVVGRRGEGALSGLELGSTSRQLVEHAALTVVVVPDAGR